MADADTDLARQPTVAATDSTAPAASATSAPARAGRYVLIRRLGAGGMGEVWEADDPELGRRVAVKLLRPEVGAGRLRMQREARAMARLAHPNVIVVHDVGDADGRVFVAMELIDGGTLRAWLMAKPRWRAIVEAFIQAGRGLVAAHGAGLVHRDFKPDNVLLRADGRVVVSDFGLARLDGAATAEPDGAPVRPAARASEIATVRGGGAPDRDGPVASPLATITDAGRLVGTPAYMAPEQHLGRGASAASDQFAYCVTLWEALYGERPFVAVHGDGITPALGVGLAIVDGKLRAPPAEVRLPRWLHRAVARGLATEPERRHPSMEALVAALSRGLARRRRGAIGAGAIAVTAGVAAVALGSARAAGPSCAAAVDQLAGTWDAARRDRVHAALAAAPRPYAAATADRVVATLDDYARRWADQRDEACRATFTDGRQSAAVLDLRYACLDRRRAELDALATALSGTVDGDVLDRSTFAAHELGGLDACVDAAALRDQQPPPADPVVRGRVAELVARSKTARALARLGRFREARAIAAAAVVDAKGLGYAPVTADALEILGDAEDDLGDLAGARASLEEASRVAADARDDALAAEAGEHLLRLVGTDQDRVDEALAMRPLIDATVRRAGDPPRLRLALDDIVADLQQAAGDTAAARTTAEAALARAERDLGPADAGVAPLLQTLESVAVDQSRWADARALRERAEALIARDYGADHPEMAGLIEHAAQALVEVGRDDEAAPLARRALDIQQRARGADHPDVLAIRLTLAMIARDQGDREGARAQLRDLVAAAQRGTDATVLATALDALGFTESELGDRAGGQAHSEAALEAHARIHGTETRDYAMAEYNVADGEIAMGRCDLAGPRLGHVTAVLDRIGAAPPTRAYPLHGLATCAMAAGHADQAAALDAKVLAACGADGCSPALVVTTRAMDAEARWLAGDRAGGAAALRAARADLARIPEAAPDLVDLDQWIRVHRVR